MLIQTPLRSSEMSACLPSLPADSLLHHHYPVVLVPDQAAAALYRRSRNTKMISMNRELTDLHCTPVRQPRPPTLRARLTPQPWVLPPILATYGRRISRGRETSEFTDLF